MTLLRTTATAAVVTLGLATSAFAQAWDNDETPIEDPNCTLAELDQIADLTIGAVNSDLAQQTGQTTFKFVSFCGEEDATATVTEDQVVITSGVNDIPEATFQVNDDGSLTPTY